MANDSSSQHNINDLLDNLKNLIQDEQRMFGETLLFEEQSIKKSNTVTEHHVVAPPQPIKAQPTKPIELAVPAKKKEVVEEPLLFQLPSPPKPPITTEAWGTSRSLDELNAQICNCMKCDLGKTRTKFVFGVGNPKATLMLIGEAPGADEDAQGEPFVGRAGQLLNKIIEAINFKREDVYICNILKCRPPGNRKPTPEESELCKPYLKKQIELVKPKVILCLGLTAAENLLATTESMTKLRGRVMQYEGVPVMITYHPAALLRNPNWKRPAWEDVQAVRKLHDELITK